MKFLQTIKAIFAKANLGYFFLFGGVVILIPLGLLVFYLVSPAATPVSPIPEKFKTFRDVLSFATSSASTKSASLPSPQPTAKPFPSRPNVKGEISIAVVGDSMVETLGEGIPALSQNLNQYFPNVKFNIGNFGVGATNVNYGLFRLANQYIHKEKTIPAITSSNFDLIVIDSFAYNHPANTQADKDQYLNTLNEMLATIRQKSPTSKIAILLTIAPDKDKFADGAPNILWAPSQRQSEAETVRIFIELAQNFAKNNNLIIVDAYHPSLDFTNDGNPIFINQTDHIHPSPEGINLISEQIAKKIFDDFLIETILAAKKP